MPFNFNVDPYNDDYTESKNYYRVLFRPSLAVQARELNQMQSILQKQIERFGAHVFREGSIVLGGAFDLETDIAYVKASAVTPNFGSYVDFEGKTIVGQTSGITAYVRAVEYDSDAAVFTFMIRYLSGSTTTDVFLPSEVVQATDNAALTFTVSSSAATGTGTIFSISSGAIFSKGFFLAFPSQTVIVDKYSSTPTKSIGFNVEESIATELTDTSLNSNALGSPNENAPGAHRYNIEVVLTTRTYKTGHDDESYVNLLDILNGVIETTEERSQYARIQDEWSKKIYDIHGDFYVRGFGVRTREHLNTGTNEGLYTEDEGGDSQKLSIDVEPGVAYVKGYEVNKLITEHVATSKANTFNYINNQLVNARTGGYFLIDEIVGSVDHDEGFIVTLYDTAEDRVTDNQKNTVSPSGLAIGTARVKALVYESGKPGTASAQMRAYLYDFQMNSGYVLGDARAIGSTTASNRFFADIVLSSGKAVFYDNNNNVLLFPIGSEFTRTIRANTGSIDTSFQFNRSEDKTATLTSAAAITATVATVDEDLSYGEGELSVAEKRELIVTLNGDTNVKQPGTVAGTSGNNLITGTSTFFDRLNPGERLLINSEEHYINVISSNTSLQLKTNLASSPAANVFFKALRSGDVLDLTANGSSGVQRTVNVASDVLTVDLKEDTTNVSPTSISVKFTYRVSRSTAGEVGKLLRANRYVKIDTSNNTANSVGPYNLGIPDVYQIRSIRMHSSAFSTGSEGSDVTDSFELVNGQTDNAYDLASIRHIGSENLISKHLLVKLDHFEPDYSSGFGYFSVDSYPVDDTQEADTTIFTYQIPKYNSSSGTVFDLRNVLDFRPVKANTAASSVTVGSATVNPATTNTFIVDTDGLRMAAPDSDVALDYSYYLARRDVVTLDRQGNYGLITGEPAVSPLTPHVPDHVMALASVYIPPYPSISETLSRVIGDRSIGASSTKLAAIRHTERDTGVYKSRIENLEYYNTLNMLEKNAVDWTIPDENGLNRFKNGFFVDGFVDHSLGDTQNPDYNIAVDKAENVIRPVFEMDSFKYKLETGVSSGYQLTGSLITRPYSETTLLENKNVTGIRNIEQSVFRFVGSIELTPDGDTWCDTTTVDKTIELGNDIPIQNTMTTEWGSWQTYGVSYKVYNRQVGERSTSRHSGALMGTFSSYAEAMAYAKKNDKDGRWKIEISGQETRSGTVTKTVAGTKTEELGSFVTDVGVIPYIRPQLIRVFVRGLKANTRFYAFFDGENMSEYVSPGEMPDDGDVEEATVSGTEGSAWRSNEFGELVGWLRIPVEGKKFRVGTKEVIVTDSPTNAIDATTYAKTHFTAIGINAAKQNTIISTKVPVTVQEEVVETRSKQKIEVHGPSCMAYSFKVDVPRGEDGIFLTSVDVWVSAKHATLGMWCELREMNSAGGITRNQIPYSEVWLKNNEVNIWDGESGTEAAQVTKVTFPAPVFLMNDTQYAFVIHTEGLNPDYYFYTSRLGETDILTGTQVTARQLTGTMFTTNNNLNYDMVPDIDLKVRFNRANFTVGTGTVVLGNQPAEFISLANADGNFARAGETIQTSEYLQLSNISNGANTITVGDMITGTTSAVTGNVVTIDGSVYYTDAYGYASNEAFTTANSSGGDKSISGNITSIDYGSGSLRSYDTNENYMIIDNSNGKFFQNAVIHGVTSGNSGILEEFETFPYSTTTAKAYHLVFRNTAASFEKCGWQSNASANSFDFYIGTSEWFPGVIDDYSSFNNEVTILSRVDELEKFGNSSPNSSARLKAIISTTSGYVSPVLDLSRAQCVYVHNILNSNTVGEDGPSGGALINKYISKVVTLEEGQDAEDIKVRLTSFKPPHSDIKVWGKFRHNEDGAYIRENNWIELTTSNTSYSTEANEYSFVEINYDIPEEYKDGNGVFQYIKNATNIVANTSGVVKASNSILITNADTIFSANDEVFYSVPTGGTPILATYAANSTITAYLQANSYVHINTVNSTAVTLKHANTTGGFSNVTILDFRTDANAEVHTLGGEVYSGYKQYAVKVGLLGTNSAKPPKASDLQVANLQL